MAYAQQRIGNLPSGLQAYLATLNFGLTSSTPVCKFGVVGGVVQKVLLANRTQLLQALVNADGQIDGFENNPLTTWVIFTALDYKTVLGYEAPSDANGNTYKTSLSGQAYYHSTPLNQFFARMLNQEMAAIVKDGAGVYWFLGYDQPLRRKTLSATTGVGETDLNGYSWSIETTERIAPYEILAAAAQGVVLDPSVNCDLPYNGSINTLTFGSCNISAFGSIII